MLYEVITNTAPYLQYAYTRIQSIFRRAGELTCGPVTLEEAAEEALANKLLKFNETVQGVAAKGMPHLLCLYLYELSGLVITSYSIHYTKLYEGNRSALCP